MFGLLNIDKPTGVTSRDVVDHLQEILRPLKVGHAGTLDPLASGVLVVCVGQATRLIGYIQQMPKRYEGTFLLGRTSDTEDIEGSVTELTEPPRPTREQIQAALPALVGEILQRPPAYSAIKVHGQRAYHLARRGQAVELEPRRVVVHAIQIVAYEYPKLVLDIQCGGGTYVRSLGRDLAVSLGTAAVMSALERTAIGRFRLEDACQPHALDAENVAAHVLSPLLAVKHLPTLKLNSDEVARVASGLTIRSSRRQSAPEIAAVDPAGQLAAILVPRGKFQLGPERTFFHTNGHPDRHAVKS